MFLDNKNNNEFLPFIYQDMKQTTSHSLLIFDLDTLQVINRDCITSNFKLKDYLRKSQAGYVTYSLTWTSEIFEHKLGFFERMGKQVSSDKIL